jgi:hypothetical protein
VIVHKEPEAVAGQERLIWERLRARSAGVEPGPEERNPLFVQVLTGHGDSSETVLKKRMQVPNKCLQQTREEITEHHHREGSASS